MPLSERLSALNLAVFPVWVYDHELFRVLWANTAALVVWRASSIEELLARDLSDASAATRTRLDNYMNALRRGEKVAEDWTLYPRGQPTTMTLHGSAVVLQDGRLAILFQAELKESPPDASMLRGVEALRHTSLIVSLISEKGEALFHNPAALRTFGDAANIASWFADSGKELLAQIQGSTVFQTELLVQTLAGQRWHALLATPTVDPVTGVRALLLQQLDVHQRRDAEDLAETRSRLLQELHQSLALVESQRQQILMLSAPILDVGEQTLAVPLIGHLSRERISEIAQRLLPAVQSQRRRFVILDLTGCSELDESGARSINQLTQAVELLGSRAIITGITPALARALLGLDFARLQTLRTLRDGIDYCRRQVQKN